MSLPKPAETKSEKLYRETVSVESAPSPALLRVRQRLEHGLSITDSPSLKLPPSPALTKLGYGTGVSVYLLKRPPKHGAIRSPWAIKKINSYGLARKGEFEKRLKYEAEILKELKHPNLVEFRHAYDDGTIALEKADQSLADDIESLLNSNSEVQSILFPAVEMTKMIKDCANGLVYLHESVSLLHGDLKPANILIKNGTFKLCDFGTCLRLDENKECLDSSKFIGTEPYMPPELKDDGLDTTYSPTRQALTDKVDIWQLALCLFEMFTLSTPHFDTVQMELIDLDLDSADEDYGECWDEIFTELAGTRPTFPYWFNGEMENKEEYRPLLDVFISCTVEKAKNRPSAPELLEIINQ